MGCGGVCGKTWLLLNSFDVSEKPPTKTATPGTVELRRFVIIISKTVYDTMDETPLENFLLAWKDSILR